MKRLLFGLLLVGCGQGPSKPYTFDQEKERITIVYEDSAHGVVCYAPLRSVRREYDYPFSCVKVRP